MIKIIYKNLINYKRFYNLLVEYLKSNLRLIFIYFFLLIVDSFVKIFAIIAIIPLVDFLSGGISFEGQEVTLYFKEMLLYFNLEYGLWTSIVLFIFATLISSITEIFFYVISRKNLYKINYFFVSEGIKRFFQKGLKFINSQSFGVIQNTFQREIQLITDGVGGMLLMISSIIQMLFLIFLSFSLSPTMTLITVLTMFFVLFTISGLNIFLSKLSNKTMLSGNEVSHALFEPILNFKQVLSFGRSKYVFQKHALIYDRHVDDALISQTLAYSIPVVFKTFSIAAILIALYFAISLGENTTLLVAALMALIRITPIAAQVSSSFASISSAIPSLNQFEELFGFIRVRNKKLPLQKFKGFNQSIELKNIFYSHNSEKSFIKDISINIPKNSYNAFIGASGSGKTTCIDIMIGLLKPTDGKVFIDGAPINSYDLDSLLNHVGYVQQTPFLFNGTVRDNLLWSNPEATEVQMWDALHLANIKDFICSSEDKLDTKVGDRGASLSGGQKQRIALAKALVRKPDILILDEATNSLDSESEALIMDSIEKISHDITIIVITHKPSTASKADCIFIFDEGRIIESGTYNDLVMSLESKLINTSGKVT